jgi:hypothetical protein
MEDGRLAPLGAGQGAHISEICIPTSGPISKDILASHRRRNLRSVIQKLSPVESGLTSFF